MGSPLVTAPLVPCSQGLHSQKSQPVVYGWVGKGSSDAERLITSHTAQRGVQAPHHMKQREDTGEQQCHSEKRRDEVRGGSVW